MIQKTIYETPDEKKARLQKEKIAYVEETEDQRIKRLKTEKENIEKHIFALRKKASDFIRIGTTYFRISDAPRLNNIPERKLIKWDQRTLITDFGKEILGTYNLDGKETPYIARFVGQVTIPSHLGYQHIYGENDNLFLNKYEELPWHPNGNWKNNENEIKNSLSMVKHIFGKQWMMGLDYLKLLFERPELHLPAIVLLSRERGTGKTTFLNWMKAIFSGNATFCSNEDLRNRFNSDYQGKLLILVDETLLNKKEDTEVMKRRITGDIDKVESKGIDRKEINFFAKYILCSNNVNSPIYVERGENRFWVLDVPTLNSDDVTIKDKLMAEIPMFLNFLWVGWKITSERKSRLWFDPKLYIFNNAFLRIVRGSMWDAENDLAESLLSLMEIRKLDHVELTAKDMLTLCARDGESKMTKALIRKIIRDRWGLSEPMKKRYTDYVNNYETQLTNTGYVYHIRKDFLLELIGKSENQEGEKKS